jgi:hypothetical protein
MESIQLVIFALELKKKSISIYDINQVKFQNLIKHSDTVVHVLIFKLSLCKLYVRSKNNAFISAFDILTFATQKEI